MTREQARSFRSGFTLIELLVVVAIITLLIAILLPSLGRARIQSQRVVCTSNLKQMGTVFYTYMMENNNTLPPGVIAGGWGWQTLTSQHLTGRNGPPYAKTMICPSALIKSGDFHYSAHYQLFPDLVYRNNPPTSIAKVAKLSELSERPDVVLIFDGTQNPTIVSGVAVVPGAKPGTSSHLAFNAPRVGEFYDDPGQGTVNPRPLSTWIATPPQDNNNANNIRWRHGEGEMMANFLFADMSAGSYKANKITAGNMRANRNGRKNSYDP